MAINIVDKNRIGVLEMAAEIVIDMNKQQAEDKYGDAKKAESWSCVKVLKAALLGNSKFVKDTNKDFYGLKNRFFMEEIYKRSVGDLSEYPLQMIKDWLQELIQNQPISEETRKDFLKNEDPHITDNLFKSEKDLYIELGLDIQNIKD